MGAKIYLQAVRELPEKWVDDKTKIVTWISLSKEDVIIASNPDFAPMIYEDGIWKDLDNMMFYQQECYEKFIGLKE